MQEGGETKKVTLTSPGEAVHLVDKIYASVSGVSHEHCISPNGGPNKVYGLCTINFEDKEEGKTESLQGYVSGSPTLALIPFKQSLNGKLTWRLTSVSG